jgi:DNA-directed RNA polymerase subunit RPC12/RpoP
MQDETRCPKCGSENVKRIIYGYPSPETVEDFYAGRVVLGGCMICPDYPDYRCANCGHEWLYSPDCQ